MVFEEALLKMGTIRKMYSIEEITELREYSQNKFANIKNFLYCPECEQPRLTHNMCVDRPSYFSTFVREEHTEECSLKTERASSAQLSSLEEEDSLDKLNNRLKTTLVSLFTPKKPKYNPFIIKTDATTGNIVFSNTTSPTINYYIPKKRITNGLSDDDIDGLKIFYGKVKLRCKQVNENYKLFFFDAMCEKKPMICSLYVSKKVYSHLSINSGDCFVCYIAFYGILESNIKDDNKYYNGVLTDSRKLVFSKML